MLNETCVCPDSELRRHVQDAGGPVGSGGRPSAGPDVADGRRRTAGVRGRGQSDRQVVQPGHADADVPLPARRKRQAARLPAAAELRLVHGRRAAGHVRVRPAERAVRRPVRGAVRHGQVVRRGGVWPAAAARRSPPPTAAQVLFQVQTRQEPSRRPGESECPVLYVTDGLNTFL